MKGRKDISSIYTMVFSLCLLFVVTGIGYNSVAPASTTQPTVNSPQSATAKHQKQQERKKVLYVNSYHWGYEWSDAITRSISGAFGAFVEPDGSIDSSNGTVFLRVFYMDSKRNKNEGQKQLAGLQAKKHIERWQPDVVITSDDNAAKYLIVPFFKNSAIPFVFCGINWDSSEYGLPCSNVTGMIEVQLIDQLLYYMRLLSDGERIAFLKGDDLSARKEARQFEKKYALSVDKRFVKTFAQWKNQYVALQEETDMLLLGNPASISGWDREEAQAVIAKNTRIATGTWDAWMAPLALITFATKPVEQGEWAAATAKRILAGTPPADIAVATNSTANVYLNMSMAKRLRIKFPMELLSRATFTGD